MNAASTSSHDTARADLTIVIVSYNGWEWLSQTLQTLQQYYLQHTAHTVRTILVDNNSDEPIVSRVESSFPWVEVLALDENRGFAAGNNVALRQVSTPYTLLLNSDMELTARSRLDNLLGYMERHRDVAVVSPKVLLADGSLDWACHRGEPTPWAAMTYFSGLETLFPNWRLTAQYHQRYKSLSEPHSIDACTAAAMLVRTSAMEAVGVLDERFFMYAEDLDWCRRFREAGHEIHFVPSMEIIHHKNKSGIASDDADTSSVTRDAFYDTMLQYYDKHYQHAPRILRTCINLSIQLLKGVSRVT